MPRLHLGSEKRNRSQNDRVPERGKAWVPTNNIVNHRASGALAAAPAGLFPKMRRVRKSPSAQLDDIPHGQGGSSPIRQRLQKESRRPSARGGKRGHPPSTPQRTPPPPKRASTVDEVTSSMSKLDSAETVGAVASSDDPGDWGIVPGMRISVDDGRGEYRAIALSEVRTDSPRVLVWYEGYGRFRSDEVDRRHIKSIRDFIFNDGRDQDAVECKNLDDVVWSRKTEKLVVRDALERVAAATAAAKGGSGSGSGGGAGGAATPVAAKSAAVALTAAAKGGGGGHSGSSSGSGSDNDSDDDDLSFRDESATNAAVCGDPPSARGDGEGESLGGGEDSASTSTAGSEESTASRGERDSLVYDSSVDSWAEKLLSSEEATLSTVMSSLDAESNAEGYDKLVGELRGDIQEAAECMRIGDATAKASAEAERAALKGRRRCSMCKSWPDGTTPEPSADGPGDWICHRCTCVNPKTRSRCSVCLGWRDGKIARKDNARGRADEHSAITKGSEDQEEGDPPFRTEGHPRLGQIVCHTNDLGEKMTGKIIGFLDENDKDSAGRPAYTDGAGRPATLFHVELSDPFLNIELDENAVEKSEIIDERRLEELYCGKEREDAIRRILDHRWIDIKQRRRKQDTRWTCAHRVHWICNKSCKANGCTLQSGSSGHVSQRRTRAAHSQAFKQGD